jgi:hypothetical protein
MLEKLHDHIQEELKTNARTDTVFIVTAILLNLLSLGVNAALTAGGEASGSTIAVLVTLIARGRHQRRRDRRAGKGKADQVQTPEGPRTDVRGPGRSEVLLLFIVAVTCTGAVAIIVPIILLIGM